MRTSYSSIETYLQCPQKYKFQVIDKIKAPKSREAIFGTIIHNALKFMFSRNPLFPTFDEVINYYREHWPLREILQAETVNDPLKRPWTDDEEKTHFEEGVKMLKKFYERNAPWNFTVVDLESRFEVMLTDEKTGQSHIIAGIIDRIDKLPDGKYEIIDYKTGKRMPSQDSLNKNLQLSLYALGLQKRWPRLTSDDIRLSLYFLKHEEKLTAEQSPVIREETKNYILNTINEIENRLRSGKEFEPMPSALCNWCSFRPLCPAWKHLYKNQEARSINQEEINKSIKEFFELKKTIQQHEARLVELQQQIKAYMAQENLTRVFGEAGVISKKNIQRYKYDLVKIKEILSPLGKWEEILKADEVKLKKLVRDFPENIRTAIFEARFIAKEYVVLTTSLNAIKKPEDLPPATS